MSGILSHQSNINLLLCTSAPLRKDGCRVMNNGRTAASVGKGVYMRGTRCNPCQVCYARDYGDVRLAPVVGLTSCSESFDMRSSASNKLEGGSR